MFAKLRKISTYHLKMKDTTQRRIEVCTYAQLFYIVVLLNDYIQKQLFNSHYFYQMFGMTIVVIPILLNRQYKLIQKLRKEDYWGILDE